ncbi:hypothetical protein RYX36_022039, partial [Vicia faba]
EIFSDVVGRPYYVAAYKSAKLFKTCNQIALAIKNEVEDLEKAGVTVIQIGTESMVFFFSIIQLELASVYP